jgi:hypothetical protein
MIQKNNRGFSALITILILSGICLSLFMAVSTKLFITEENLEIMTTEFQDLYHIKSCDQISRISINLSCLYK